MEKRETSPICFEGLLGQQERCQQDLRDAGDRALFRMLQQGSTAAFEELFVRYETRLVGYAARYVGSVDLAQDVCQEVFLKLIRKPPRMLFSESLAPWLFRVARNLAIDKRRSTKFEIPEERSVNEPVEDGDPLRNLSSKSDLEHLRHLVAALPESLREVVELRIHGEVSFKEIARILDIPQGTALWRMHRALKVLRTMWRRHGQSM